MASAVYTPQLTDSPKAVDDLYLPLEHAVDTGVSTAPPTPPLTYASTLTSLSQLSPLQPKDPSIDDNASIDAMDAHNPDDGWVLAETLEERKKARTEEWARSMDDLAVRKANIRARRKANAAKQSSRTHSCAVCWRS